MLIACTACTAVVLAVVVAVVVGIFNKLALRATVRASQWNLQLAAEGMERILGDIMDLAHWTAANNRILSFVTATDPSVVPRLQLDAARLVQDRINSSIGGRYIDKLIISSENGYFIEQGLVAGLPEDVAVASSMPFFERKLAENDARPDVLHVARFPYAVPVQALPIVKRINWGVPGVPKGWTYISVNRQAVADSFLKFPSFGRSRLFILIGEELWEFDAGGTLRSAAEEEELLSVVSAMSPLESGRQLPLGGSRHTAVIHRSENLGWILAEVFRTPLGGLGSEDYLLLLLILSTAILLLAVAVILIINRMVNRPIRNIVKQLEAIASGDFGANRDIESGDEIGRIGIGINRMAAQVRRLIDQRLADEKKRKILELNMLQSQINPHFLYNTLNSIKWMADMQKAKGISTTVAALAGLLKEIAKGTDEVIPLRDELELLGKYIEIERTISGNHHEVRYDIPDAAVLDCGIIKFTLQPLVENAFFHGLAPKEAGGMVTIAVQRTASSLVLQVRDDGVGMPAEQVGTLLAPKERGRGKFNSIGLHNVDERIKLSFGRSYGLAVRSVLGQGTTVEVRLPCRGMDGGGRA